MMVRANVCVGCLVVLMFFAMPELVHAVSDSAETRETAQFEPTWESLAQHETPEWFRDAKLGIYFHWGVYSVPAFGDEWYPRHMYFRGSREYNHHVAAYGNITEFNYHDFIDDFTGEHFDAQEWVALFKRAGARFAGPVAEHHDGFAMWDSAVTPWNATNMGPQRDILGELAEALRDEQMKLIATFHHARNLQRYADRPDETHFFNSHYPYIPGTATVSTDPTLRLLYGNVPEDEWLESVWFGKLKEVIDNYQPDIIWFDSWLDMIPNDYRRKFAAYYLNAAQTWNRGVVIVRKHNALPLEFTVLDLEKSRQSGLSPQVWMTDDTISTGSWSYTTNLRIKPASQVIHGLVDTVAKNGVVLLNISPKANGVIPEDQRAVLYELGDWMEQNGEAIYDTRPWLTFGEGPVAEPEGGFEDRYAFLQLQYSHRDIRYTQTKDGKTLYAIVMGRPEAEVAFEAVRVAQPAAGATVSLLGYSGDIDYRVDESGQLTLLWPASVPEQSTYEIACAFKLSGFDISLNPLYVPNAIVLKAEEATLQGRQIQKEQQGGRTNIGYWNNSDDRAHWLLAIPEAGEYQFRGEFAAMDASRMRLQVDGKEAAFRVPRTGGWDAAAFVEMGTIRFERPGVYHLQLVPAAAYQPVNIWQIQCVRQ